MEQERLPPVACLAIVCKLLHMVQLPPSQHQPTHPPPRRALPCLRLGQFGEVPVEACSQQHGKAVQAQGTDPEASTLGGVACMHAGWADAEVEAVAGRAQHSMCRAAAFQPKC